MPDAAASSHLTVVDVTKCKVASAWPTDRPLVACRFDPLGRYVFCGAEEKTVVRFKLDGGTKTALEGGHESWVHGLACTPDGKFLISGGCEGKLAWWEAAAETPTPLRQIAAHKGWIRQLAVSPDGQLLASAGNDGMVRLWNTADGTLVRELAGHTRDVYTVLWHPSGEFLCSGDLLGNVRQWDVRGGSTVRTLEAKEVHSYNAAGQQVDFGGVRGLALSPDGKFLAVGGLHKATNPLGAVHEPLVMLYEWETGTLVKQQVTEGITGGGIWRLAYLADGTLVGASGGSSGGWLLFWKADEEKAFHKFQTPNILRDMDLSADRTQFATAHHDKHVRITAMA
ncbi:WD40 repeat domain-containing protein [Chlorogloeopsis sp. ULAP01]|uniref:WD40 repeat domain-containing protein n=1 Tax=Chlorogloeopsis sp. ULAP01 TaxID=3056483 RepID=UPI0025AA5828|nr:WD40 repeat domain-containing protein [Chlorogloeopsis sp. ULAP01]MDM9385843.1 WD40 repeat domain-containing protein [Chlorogloeopsis sp. ULAP01]